MQILTQIGDFTRSQASFGSRNIAHALSILTGNATVLGSMASPGSLCRADLLRFIKDATGFQLSGELIFIDETDLAKNDVINGLTDGPRWITGDCRTELSEPWDGSVMRELSTGEACRLLPSLADSIGAQNAQDIVNAITDLMEDFLQRTKSNDQRACVLMPLLHSVHQWIFLGFKRGPKKIPVILCGQPIEL